MGDFVSLWRHNPLAIGAADDGDGVEQGLGVRPLSSLTAAAPSGPNSGTSPMSSSFRAQGVSDDPMGAPRLSGGMAPASSPHGVQSPYAMGLTRTSSQANSQASSGSMSGPAAPASKGGAGPSRTPSVMSSGPSMTRAGSGKGPLEALRDELFAGLDDAFDEPAASRGPAQTSTSILDSTAAAPDRTQGSAPAPGRRAGQDPGSAAAAASQMVQSTASLPRHISAAASISDPVQLERPASAGVRERRSSGMGGSDVASEASSKHWGSDAGSAAQGTGNVGSVASGGGAQNGASSNAGARTTAPAGGSGAGAPPVPPPRPTGEATGLLGQVIAAIADPQPQPFPLHKQQPNSSHGGQGTRRSSNASAPQIPQVPVAESSLEPHEYVEPEVESYADDDFESESVSASSHPESKGSSRPSDRDEWRRSTDEEPRQPEPRPAASAFSSTPAPQQAQSNELSHAVDEEELMHGWSPLGPGAKRTVDEDAYQRVLHLEKQAVVPGLQQPAAEEVVPKQRPAASVATPAASSFASSIAASLQGREAQARPEEQARMRTGTASAPGGSAAAMHSALFQQGDEQPYQQAATAPVVYIPSVSTTPSRVSEQSGSKVAVGDTTPLAAQVIGLVRDLEQAPQVAAPAAAQHAPYPAQVQPAAVTPSHSGGSATAVASPPRAAVEEIEYLASLLKSAAMSLPGTQGSTSSSTQPPVARVSAPAAAMSQQHAGHVLDYAQEQARALQQQEEQQPAPVVEPPVPQPAAHVSSEDAVNTLKMKALAYLARFQMERAGSGDEEGETEEVSEEEVDEQMDDGQYGHMYSTTAAAAASAPHTAQEALMAGLHQIKTTTSVYRSGGGAAQGSPPHQSASPSSPTQRSGASTPRSPASRLDGARLGAATAATLVSTFGNSANVTVHVHQDGPRTVVVSPVATATATATISPPPAATPQPRQSQEARRTPSTSSSSAGSTTQALLQALHGMGITPPEGQEPSAQSSGPMQALLEQLQSLELSAQRLTATVSSATSSLPTISSAGGTGATQQLLLTSSAPGLPQAAQGATGSTSGEQPGSAEGFANATLRAWSFPTLPEPGAAQQPKPIGMLGGAPPTPTVSAASSLLPDSSQAVRLQNPVEGVDGRTVHRTGSGSGLFGAGSNGVPGASSRLASSTGPHEPPPGPPLVPTTLATMLAVSEMPGSAASMGFGRASISFGGSPVQPEPSIGAAQLPTAPAPAAAAAGAGRTQQARDKQGDIQDLLQRLKQAGYTVPDHAALVLSLLLDEADAMDRMSTAEVTAELRKHGAPPRQAGWVPQARPVAATAAAAVAATHAGRSSSGGGSGSIHTGSAFGSVEVIQGSNPSSSHPGSSRHSLSGVTTTSISVGQLSQQVLRGRAMARSTGDSSDGPEVTFGRELGARLPTVMEAGHPGFGDLHPDGSQGSDGGPGLSRGKGRSASAGRSRRPSSVTQDAVGVAQPGAEPLVPDAPGAFLAPGAYRQSLEASVVPAKAGTQRPRSSSTGRAMDVAQKRAQAAAKQVPTGAPESKTLLQEWRSAMHKRSTHNQQIEAAMRPAPSSPRKARQQELQELASMSPLLSPQRRGANPAEAAAKEGSVGAGGDYYHDSRVGVITTAVGSAMDAWRAHEVNAAALATAHRPGQATLATTGAIPAGGPSSGREQTHQQPGTATGGATMSRVRGSGGYSGRLSAGGGRPPATSAPATPRTPRQAGGSSPARPRPASKTPGGPGAGSILDTMGSGGLAAASGYAAAAAASAGGAYITAGAPVAGFSQAPKAVPASPGREAITVAKPSGWQERETRHWLASLSLDVLPHEEAAPFMDNPLRNGILLCDVAAAVTGMPVKRVAIPTRDLRAARANILLALDHLGLLADLDEATLEEMVAGPDGQLAHLQGVNGARAPSTHHVRSYAAKLKERQLKVGAGLMWEVERILQGNKPAIWGLLNHIRLACTGPSPTQPFLGPHNHEASAAQAAERARAKLRRRTQSMPGVAAGPGSAADAGHTTTTFTTAGSGPPLDVSLGLLGQQPAPYPGAATASGGASGSRPRPQSTGRIRPNSASATPAAATGVGFSTAASSAFATGGPTSPRQYRQYSPRAHIPDTEVGMTGMLGSGVGPLAYAVGPRPLSPRRKRELEQELEREQRAAAERERRDMEEAMSPGKDSIFALPSSAPGSPRSAVAAWELLTKPTYPTPAVPYSHEEINALESSLIRWLISLGAISRQMAAQGFTSLLSELEDGVFMCWLVTRITGRPIKGVNKRPMHEAARHANMGRAIEALRLIPSMSRRFLNFEEALLRFDRSAITGLLEDMHRLADGQPSAGTVIQPNAKPYLPYASTALAPAPASTVLAEALDPGVAGASTVPASPGAKRPQHQQRASSAPRERQSPAFTPRADGQMQAPGTSHRGLQQPGAGEVPSQPSSGVASTFVTPTKARPSVGPPPVVSLWSPAGPVGRDLMGPDAAARQSRTKERRAAAGMAAAPRVPPSQAPAAPGVVQALMGGKGVVQAGGAASDLDLYLDQQGGGQRPKAAAGLGMSAAQVRSLMESVPMLRLRQQVALAQQQQQQAAGAQAAVRAMLDPSRTGEEQEENVAALLGREPSSLLKVTHYNMS